MSTDPRTIPSFTDRLWSEEVGMAAGGDVSEVVEQYKFSNGRTFSARYPYGPPVATPLTTASTGQAGQFTQGLANA